MKKHKSSSMKKSAPQRPTGAPPSLPPEALQQMMSQGGDTLNPAAPPQPGDESTKLFANRGVM